MTWNGSSYDRVADAQAASGIALLDRLVLPAGARVVDAGCGSGRVTEALLDRRPDITVEALDVSADMIAAAHDRLAAHHDRVVLRVADLASPWPLTGPADAVISTHTFHWVLDHDRLFAAAHEALRPGGSLVAVAGGHGSLERVRQAATGAGVVVEGRNHYATADDTRRRLLAAGFVDVWTWLEPDPVTFPTRESLAEYLAEAALAPYDGGRELAPVVARSLARPEADFVRLHLLARRPVPGTPIGPEPGKTYRERGGTAP